MKKYLHIHIWWIFQPTIVEYQTYLLGQVSVFWWNLGSMVLMYSGLIASPMIFWAFHTKHLLCFRNATDWQTKHDWKRYTRGSWQESYAPPHPFWIISTHFHWTVIGLERTYPWQNRKDLSAFAMAIKLSQRVNHVVVRYLHLSCIRTMAMILQPAKHPPNLKSAATARGLKKNSPRSLSPTSPKNHAWILFKNPHSHPGPAPGRLSFQLLCLKKR